MDSCAIYGLIGTWDFVQHNSSLVHAVWPLPGQAASLKVVQLVQQQAAELSAEQWQLVHVVSEVHQAVVTAVGPHNLCQAGVQVGLGQQGQLGVHVHVALLYGALTLVRQVRDGLPPLYLRLD